LSLVLTAHEDGITTVTLNQPEKRNPISDLPMIDALEEVMRAADADVQVRAVILTGAGSAFSSGGDIAKMVPGGGLRDALPAQTRRNYRDGIQRLPLLFQSLDVPVIAAVNGPAIGAGCDLACMCDIRIAANTARFAESFVKIGLVPGDGGAWLLPRVIGFPRATQMALTGEMIDAAEALSIGLVTKVVPPEELMSAARAMAQAVIANPPHAVRMTKRLLREAQTASLQTVLEMSAALQAIAHETMDHAEAIEAFKAKRPPEFKGR
jgi:enoyl-CoA hydratase/carnithine racemase